VYDTSIKSTFVHYRSAGHTLEKISQMMGINRTTLIQWNKEFYADIKIAERDDFEYILQGHNVQKRRRVTVLAEALEVCYDRLEAKERRFDNFDLLKEIEKLTKLLSIEMEDKKFSSLISKSASAVKEDFPIIIDDLKKYREYDPLYHEEEYDFENDPYELLNEEQKKEARRRKEKQEEAIEALNEKFEKEEEQELREEAELYAVNVPDSEFEDENKKFKPAKRIVNRKVNNKPDQNPAKPGSKITGKQLYTEKNNT